MLCFDNNSGYDINEVLGCDGGFIRQYTRRLPLREWIYDCAFLRCDSIKGNDEYKCCSVIFNAFNSDVSFVINCCEVEILLLIVLIDVMVNAHVIIHQMKLIVLVAITD